MAETSPTTNRLAIISLSSALLTLFSFCVGVAPIPLTGWVCFPLALLFGLVSLVSGIMALSHIRVNGENGRWMAFTGVILGGLIIIATPCAILLTIYAVTAVIAQALNIPIPTPQAP